MKNYYPFLRRLRFITATIFIISCLTTGSAIAQSSQPKIEPDNTYGTGGTKETTVSKDEFGRDVTTEKTYDGSNPKKLRKVSVKTRHYDNSGTVTRDTVYYENGMIKNTQEYEYNNDGTWKLTVKEYSDFDGSITGGYIRTKAKGEFRQYEWDQKEMKFKDWDNKIAGNKNEKKGEIVRNSFADISGGYNFLSRDMGDQRVAMHGANASFTWYFRGSVTEVPIGIKLSANTASRKNGDETMTLNSIRVGPVAGLTPGNDDMKINIHVQLGVAMDGYRFVHEKFTNNSFTASAGGSLDWYFTDRLAARFSPEALLTRFNNQSQWHFIGSTGIVYKIKIK